MATIENILETLTAETIAEAQQNVEFMRNSDVQAMSLRMIAYDDLT
jgi:hypothetical protein